MKVLYIISLCLNLMAINIFGQEKIIDIRACRDWESLTEINGKSCLLDAEGNFMMFKSYSENSGAITVLKNLKLDAYKRFIGTYNEGIFNNGRMFAFQLPGDSLVIFDTKMQNYTYCLGVKWYFIIESENTNMIAYFTERAGKGLLTIWNIREGHKMELPNINMDKHWLNKERTALLVKGGDGLICINLCDLKQTLVTSNIDVENAAFTHNKNGIAYISRETNGYQLKYFDIRSGITEVLVSNASDYLKDNWELKPGELFFDNDDNNVFFKISRVNSYDHLNEDSIITRDVNVWSYQDLSLQERQLSDLLQQPAFTTMINIHSKKINQLESDELALEPLGNAGEYFVLTTRVNENEFYWNSEKRRMFLYSAITGNRTLIAESAYPGFMFIGISPDCRFLIWFDESDGNYYSYNIQNGKALNISKSTDGSLSVLNQRGTAAKAINKGYPYSSQYWINNCSALIVNGRNDVWQLDPLAEREPINLTNGYGDVNNIRFRPVDNDGHLVKFDNGRYLVWAFDNLLKQNGFWTVVLGKTSNPVKLVMSDDAYFFYPQAPIFSTNDAEDPSKFGPIKASKKKLYILRVMNSSHAPNLFYTTDFRKFEQCTNISPNKGYIWPSTKLVTWSLPDGQQAEGILHMPGNFDSTKKYPIIFNYYERRSECLNVFRSPELSGHNINIPWYVSRGYFIFEPDFYYKRGETSKSVIKSVEAALVELRKLPYIDQNKMGIQGQSHGGYETNILATGTKFFAAACEMAGYTNIISEYGSIRPGGFSNQIAADLDQRNIGLFPWEHPEVFIENSPVFHISRMNTPLLMIHNKEDGSVSFSQAIELYLSMRRLGKEVWLLQYDGEGHTIKKNENKLDFTLRMQQFFDHYLKDAPMPIWMSKGIPALLKGRISGLRYEPSPIGTNN